MISGDVIIAVNAILDERAIPFDWVVEHAPHGDVAAVLTGVYRRGSVVAIRALLALLPPGRAAKFCLETARKFNRMTEYMFATEFVASLTQTPPPHVVARNYLSHAYRAFKSSGGRSRNFRALAHELLPPSEFQQIVAARLGT